MERPRPRIGAELVPLALVLASLAATTALVIGVQKRYLDEEAARNRPSVLAVARPAATVEPQPTPEPEPEPEPRAVPAPKPAPPPPPDPTPAALAKIKEAEAEQRRETAALLSRIREAEKALDDAKAKGQQSTRELASLQERANRLIARAESTEFEAARNSIEIDVLEKQRKETKEIASEVSQRTSYAILPHRGPNGTWRRPIVIECHDGQVSVRPKGATFGIGELLDLGFGNSTFRGMVAREALRVQRGLTPDGHSVVPYFYFLIRPDGIKAYYAARRQLEPLGIAFGYELVDQDWDVEFPDLDDVRNWSEEEEPKALADAGAPGGNPKPGAAPFGLGPAGEKDADNPFVWSTPDGLRGERPRGPGGPGEPGTGRGDRAGGPLGGPGPGQGGGPLAGKPNGAPGLEELEPFDGGPAGSNPRRGTAGGGDLAPLDGNPGNPAARRGLGAGGSGVTGMPDGFLSGGDVPPGTGGPDGPNLPKGLELPPGLGEAIPSATGIDKEWAAKVLANRGGSIPPGLAGAAEAVGALGGRNGDQTGTQGGPGGASRGTPDGTGDARGGSAEKPGDPSNGSGGAGSPGESGGAPGSNASGRPDLGSGGMPGQGGGGSSGLGFGSSRIEAFEMVIACESRGVVIHPGDYRVTTRGLAGKEPLLAGQLRALLQMRRDERPGKMIVPSIRFVIEPGGHATYATARNQIRLDGIDWPSTMQISGGDVLRGLSREDW